VKPFHFHGSSGLLSQIKKYVRAEVNPRPIKEAAAELVGQGLRASNEVINEMVDFVENAAQSPEWAGLQEDARQALRRPCGAIEREELRGSSIFEGAIG
jgi:hypothetical protein